MTMLKTSNASTRLSTQPDFPDLAGPAGRIGGLIAGTAFAAVVLGLLVIG